MPVYSLVLFVLSTAILSSVIMSTFGSPLDTIQPSYIEFVFVPCSLP